MENLDTQEVFELLNITGEMKDLEKQIIDYDLENFKTETLKTLQMCISDSFNFELNIKSDSTTNAAQVAKRRLIKQMRNKELINIKIQEAFFTPKNVILFIYELAKVHQDYLLLIPLVISSILKMFTYKLSEDEAFVFSFLSHYCVQSNEGITINVDELDTLAKKYANEWGYDEIDSNKLYKILDVLCQQGVIEVENNNIIVKQKLQLNA